MLVHVLACDYDGTIADAGRIAPATRRALGRVRESGRKVVLVTGRMLDDLRRVCPELDALFDAVVAENGALLYLPPSRALRVLGEAPEPALVDALGRRGIPIAVGASIVATEAPHAEAALAAIREAGVERALVFNKGALMLLPGGVTKATGLEAALAALRLSLHNTVGVGDAENDHAFLGRCECAVAVADAVPALRERADLVTAAPAGRGVVELIETQILRDAVDLLPRLRRHRIPLGERPDGTPVGIPAHRARVVVVGRSRAGLAALAGVLVARLVEAGRTVCVLDGEGAHRALGERSGVVVLGVAGKPAAPRARELARLLAEPRTSLVLDLSALPPADRVRYAGRALASVAAVRATTGVPHWLLLAGAAGVAPPGDANESLCLLAHEAAALPPALRARATVLVSPELDAFATALRTLARRGPQAPALPVDGWQPGQALLVELPAAGPGVERFWIGGRPRGPRPTPAA